MLRPWLWHCQAEFRGIAKGITEVLWIRKLINELGYTQDRACQLYCDNKETISIFENPIQHDRTKHVEVDQHFLKENLENNTISIPFVKSKEQIVDILIKVVDTKVFEATLYNLGVGSPTIHLEESVENTVELVNN